MSIWKKKNTIEEINLGAAKSILNHLDIQITEIAEDYLSGSMPVDSRTYQPMGILHGGASVVLAESLGSIAGNMACAENSYCVGLEINANHLAQVRNGRVEGVAKPVHLGRKTQVWEIKIYREDKKLVCISRITLAVLAKANNDKEN